MSVDDTEGYPLRFGYTLTSRERSEWYLSDGEHGIHLAPSHVLGDPLALLLEALAEVLLVSGEARCRWFEEPGETRWLLRRDGDHLHITILAFRHFIPPESDELGEVLFSRTCNLWKFTARACLFASRVAASEGGEWMGRYRQYHELRALLEERKRAEQSERRARRGGSHHDVRSR